MDDRSYSVTSGLDSGGLIDGRWKHELLIESLQLGLSIQIDMSKFAMLPPYPGTVRDARTMDQC